MHPHPARICPRRSRARNPEPATSIVVACWLRLRMAKSPHPLQVCHQRPWRQQVLRRTVSLPAARLASGLRDRRRDLLAKTTGYPFAPPTHGIACSSILTPVADLASVFSRSTAQGFVAVHGGPAVKRPTPGWQTTMNDAPIPAEAMAGSTIGACPGHQLWLEYPAYFEFCASTFVHGLSGSNEVMLLARASVSPPRSF